MTDAFGNCKWCGKHTDSSSGCFECNSFKIFIPETWTGDASGTCGFVHDPGWYGPAKFLPERYSPLLTNADEIQ